MIFLTVVVIVAGYHSVLSDPSVGCSRFGVCVYCAQTRRDSGCYDVSMLIAHTNDAFYCSRRRRRRRRGDLVIYLNGTISLLAAVCGKCARSNARFATHTAEIDGAGCVGPFNGRLIPPEDPHRRSRPHTDGLMRVWGLFDIF